MIFGNLPHDHNGTIVYLQQNFVESREEDPDLILGQ